MPAPATLEAQVVRFADRIAYINHDLDDAVRAGVLDAGELPRQPLDVLGHTHGARINTLVLDLIDQSADQPEVRLSPAVFSALDALRDFLFEQVYTREGARIEHEKAVRLIRDLFSHFLEHPDEMPHEYHQAPGDLPTRVADFIAGHDGPVRPSNVRAALPSPGLAHLEPGAPVAGGSSRKTSKRSGNGPTSSSSSRSTSR